MLLFVLNFAHKNLRYLLSSAYLIKFLFNEILFLDLLDRFLIFDQKKFILNQNLTFKFVVKLPFSNVLSKFKNKVYLLLYFLVFEYLTGQSPIIVPVYAQKILTVVEAKKKISFDLNQKKTVTKFLLTSKINKNSFFNSLFFLSLCVSANTYSRLVVPSKYIALVFENKLQLSSCTLQLKSGLSAFFEFLGIFDELILSKVKLTVLYKTVNLNNLKMLTPFVFQSLNFNLKDSVSFISTSTNNVVIERLPVNSLLQ